MLVYHREHKGKGGIQREHGGKYNECMYHREHEGKGGIQIGRRGGMQGIIFVVNALCALCIPQKISVYSVKLCIQSIAHHRPLMLCVLSVFLKNSVYSVIKIHHKAKRISEYICYLEGIAIE